MGNIRSFLGSVLFGLFVCWGSNQLIYVIISSKPDFNSSFGGFIIALLQFLLSIVVIIILFLPGLIGSLLYSLFTGEDVGRIPNDINILYFFVGGILLLVLTVIVELATDRVRNRREIASKKREIQLDEIKRKKDEFRRKKEAEEAANLEKENKKRMAAYQKVMDLYKIVVIEVNKCQNYSLMVEADKYYRALKAEDLRNLIYKGNWEQVNEILNSITDDLNQLKNNALFYQQQNYEYRQENESTNSSIDNAELDIQKALKILELEELTTKEDIDKAWKKALKKFNVDQRQNLEEHIKELLEKTCKEINNAHDFLIKKLRGNKNE